MPSYLQCLFRQTLYEIASELIQAEQEAFKFLCAGQVSDSDREGNDLWNVFEKLQQTCSISCENLEFLKESLTVMRRPDLIASKVDAYEFKRELVFVLEDYGIMKKCGGSEMNRRSTRVAKRIVEETEGNIFLTDLLVFDDTSADVVQILDRFIETTAEKKTMSWAAVAMIVVFSAEVVCAREAERERRLKKVVQKLDEYLMPWISRNGGWIEFYAFIEDRTSQPDKQIHADTLEEIFEQFQAIELFQ